MLCNVFVKKHGFFFLVGGENFFWVNNRVTHVFERYRVQRYDCIAGGVNSGCSR